MKLLFDPILFNGKPLLWTYRKRSVDDYGGYYHWHQCCEILLVHEGQGSVIVDQHTYEIRKGMLFFFQPFELHKVYADVSRDSPYERTIIHFDPVAAEQYLRAFPTRHDFYSFLWQGQMREGAYDLAGELEYADRSCRMYESARLDGRGQTEEEITLLLLQLLSFIQSVWKEKQGTAELPSKEQRRLHYSETIMQWLEAHFAEEKQLERLAEKLHLSKFYVSRVFRQETGSSVTDYLIARRIKQACRLLQTTNLPVERIGFEVGLPNVSYFIQLFKKVVGTTPLKYRKHQ